MACPNTNNNNNNGCKGFNPCESAGVPDKVCIQAERVFDACISQIANENLTLTGLNFPEPPKTFVSAEVSGPAEVSDVVVTPQPCSACSRVQYTITVPVTVTALDADGNTETATTYVTINRDILLKVPKDAVIPTNIDATVYFKAVSGSILSDTSVQVVCCYTLITKVTAKVDIIVPAYGYAALPACTPYSEDVCSGVFSLPVYPK
ncbi:MAG: hypothetical protein LBN25_04655 [Christensenellaceae bacterium]|jgi:hypothetical protein|nr:hypothetical protein [Christensenellaceae bacterium]